MLYVLFLILSLVYNWRKFSRSRVAFLSSLVDAKNISHREMILSHHFHVFILEVFLAEVTAHLMTEKAFSVGLIGIGAFYLSLLFCGFFVYRFFVRHVEKLTGLSLWGNFKGHLVRELRVNLALIMLPIFTYAVLNVTFQDGYEEWGNFWLIGLIFNILFVSVVTVVCTVIIMLRLIPNREITEPEYLEIIQRKLDMIGRPQLRLRWIETDFKNAFVVGIKLLRFSNQTMFIGKSLRETLTLEEFDAIVSHELAHLANRHIHQRMIDLIKNFISILMGSVILFMMTFGITLLYWGEDASLHSGFTSVLMIAGFVGWFLFNYILLFDGIRAHEFEADAYAILNLGAKFEAFQSALVKITNTDELPEFLRRRSNEKRGLIKRVFSTHPELDERFRELARKIELGLPFNHYVSPMKKIRKTLGTLLQWKVATPMAAALAVIATYSVIQIQKGRELVAFIETSPREKILKNPEVASFVNKRPTPLAQSLMYTIVKKQDEVLIDHYLSQGADKGRVLIYLSQLKNAQLFEKYAASLLPQLSDEDYLRVLGQTARSNFTEGYRLLVNSQRFETLSGAEKLELAKLHRKGSERSPASVK